VLKILWINNLQATQKESLTKTYFIKSKNLIKIINYTIKLQSRIKNIKNRNKEIK